jgi:hypothetical protein
MEQPAEWRQLDLLVLATSASQHQRLDPMIRAEVTGAAQVAYRRMQRRPRKGEEGDR